MLKIETVEISSLISDPSNVRLHDDKNIAAIKGSLLKFGQQKPIVVDKNNIVIAGNGTLLASKEIGKTHIDIVRTELEGAAAIAFALADNRTAELADWDEIGLTKTLEALHAEDYNIAEIGFDLSDFLKKEVDYSILEDGEQPNLDNLRDGVRKALQIEFELEHYDEAFELVKFWRSQGAYIGMLLIDKLKAEKAKIENNQS